MVERELLCRAFISRFASKYALLAPMRFQQSILVVVFALSCLAGALSATEALKAKTGLSTTSYSTIAGRDLNGGRSLRVHTQVNDGDGEEERAWADLSAAKSKVRTFLSRMHLKDTTKEIEAKKALGLYGLSGKALKSHENYIYWRPETELAKFSKWAKDGVPTFKAWNKFGLGKVREDQVEGLINNRKFMGYLTYMSIFDRTWKARGIAPPVSAKSTGAELKARAMGLAASHMDDEYAKLALGLGGLTGNTLKQHQNYRFYQTYLNGIARLQ